jgi:hypothetical protein
MVAELSPFLSDATPGLARRAKLGDRCPAPTVPRMFSPVPFEALADFRSALAILAEPAGAGRFIPWAVAVIDSAGRLRAEDGSWPSTAPKGSVAFVHFLSDADDREMAEDLIGAAVPAEFNLAA